MGMRCYGQLKHTFSKKAISQVSSLCTVVFLSITQCKPPLSPPLSFPTVCADFLAAFLHEHKAILCNTIVYGDITVYRNNVKRLRFLKNLRSASVMRFTP